MSRSKWYITKIRPTDSGYGTYSGDMWPWLVYHGRPASVTARRHGSIAFRSHALALDYVAQPDAYSRFRHRRSSINYK